MSPSSLQVCQAIVSNSMKLLKDCWLVILEKSLHPRFKPRHGPFVPASERHGGTKAEQNSEFEVSLIYTVSSRPAKLYSEFLSQKKKRSYVFLAKTQDWGSALEAQCMPSTVYNQWSVCLVTGAGKLHSLVKGCLVGFSVYSNYFSFVIDKDHMER